MARIATRLPPTLSISDTGVEPELLLRKPMDHDRSMSPVIDVAALAAQLGQPQRLRAMDARAATPREAVSSHRSTYADRLAQGVADCLTAPELEVRAQALVFFQSKPRAAGGELVRDLVVGDRRLFHGVPDPVHPGTDLDWQLLAALAVRTAIGDAQAIDLARHEALQPGRAAPLIAELVDADRDWVVANAEAIVRGTPAAGATLLIQLQAAVPDVMALGRRIVPLCHGDPASNSTSRGSSTTPRSASS